MRIVKASLIVVGLTGCGEIESASVSDNFVDASRTDAMRNGTIVSDQDRRRSGIVAVVTNLINCPPPDVARVATCTGTVFRTSAFRRETWVVTAAHCFVVDGCIVDTVEIFDRPGPDGNMLAEDGDWTVHPNYQDNPLRHDLAIVEFAVGVSVENDGAPDVHEYYRPFSSVDQSRPVNIFGMGVQEKDRFCNGTVDRWDFSLRYAMEDEYSSQGYGMIETDSFLEPAAARPGDSGGPWLMNIWGSTDLDASLEHGIITGVTSNVECGNSRVEASSTFAGQNENFLINTSGSAAVFDNNWTRPVCWTDWCNYADSERASLILALM